LPRPASSKARTRCSAPPPQPARPRAESRSRYNQRSAELCEALNAVQRRKARKTSRASYAVNRQRASLTRAAARHGRCRCCSRLANELLKSIIWAPFLSHKLSAKCPFDDHRLSNHSCCCTPVRSRGTFLLRRAQHSVWSWFWGFRFCSDQYSGDADHCCAHLESLLASARRS
jgi:hypothetical protein